MTGAAFTRLPAARPGISEIGFCSWLAQAAPGDLLEYHRGFLCLDRGGFGATLKSDCSRTLNIVAKRAFDLAERGFVHLVQRRLGADSFSYLAIARPRPDRTPISFETLMSEEAA